jgi:NAD kinase
MLWWPAPPSPRVIRVRVKIDDIEYGVLNGDGVIVATDYGLHRLRPGAGGQCSRPRCAARCWCPLRARHPRRAAGAAARGCVSLEVVSGFPAILSIDGQVERPLSEGDVVTVRLSHTRLASYARSGPITSIRYSATFCAERAGK